MDRTFQNGTDVHAQCASCYLSSAEPYTDQGHRPGRSIARSITSSPTRSATTTPFRTLEFSCNSHKDNKESIYFDNISWYGTGHLAPSIRDPRKMYRRLFSHPGESIAIATSPISCWKTRTRCKRDLGYTDRQKFAEYFDSIRTIETQMDRLEKMKAELAKVNFDEPPEAYLPRGEYIRLMGDLMVVALQTGLTNVTTFMVGPERWDTPYKFEGLFDKPRSHHQMSHNQTKMIDDLLKVDRFHMEQFAYLLEKMDADRGSRRHDAARQHALHLRLRSRRRFDPSVQRPADHRRRWRRDASKTGQHINMPEGTPLANLWLTQARMMGLEMERFADSTGTIGQLLAER